MLSRLSIRDIVLIDRLDIDFADGLAVLTGETGAGKSILLDAFVLALGARGDQALIRQGAEQGQVTAAFEVGATHPARALLKANDIAAEDELILRRVQFADGRTRAFINEQPVGVQVMKEIGAALVEIHGQHDERALVDASTHRRLLDAFGALDEEAATVAVLWEARRSAAAAAEAHRAEMERAKREGDWLRHAVEELGKLSPQAGEETTLAERRSVMMQAEKVAEDLREAHEVIAGGNSTAPVLASVIRRLERRAAQAPTLIEPVVKALDSALAAVDELAALAQRYKSDIALIDASEVRLKALENEALAAEFAYRKSADALSKERTEAAAALDKAVSGELKPLKLEGAKFTTHIESDAAAAGPSGIDRVEFWVQTNPGARPGPLMKVASGGELTRFLLALKVVLADRGSAPTLVFDEIDTGVGGAAADAIGVRLKRLARGVQVLAVTHAPQVAVRANRHYVISKDALGGGRRVATRIREVAAEKRREEIARMLAGAEITNEARAAAEQLIKAAS